jgi:tetratricopeptide (TPR) repeat protein
MKIYIGAAAIVLIAVACQRSFVPVQTPVLNQETVNASGQKIVNGHASVSILSTPICRDWFQAQYDVYQPDTAILRKLRPLLKNVRMDIFLGSWCGDSRRETPRMLKILQDAGMDTARIQLFFVDNSDAAYKQSIGGEEKGKFIHHVPSFLVYDLQKETGRIIESPRESLEKDLLHILNKTVYAPQYPGTQYWIQQFGEAKKLVKETEIQSACKILSSLLQTGYELNTLGRVLMAAKEYTAAANVYRTNSMLFPKEAEIWMNLGNALEKAGEKESARLAYQKGLSVLPDNMQIKSKLDLLR